MTKETIVADLAGFLKAMDEKFTIKSLKTSYEMGLCEKQAAEVSWPCFQHDGTATITIVVNK